MGHSWMGNRIAGARVERLLISLAWIAPGADDSAGVATPRAPATIASVVGKIDICCRDHFGRTPKSTRETPPLPGFFVNFALCKLSFSLDIDR
jgi:hypothetical protein